MSVKVVDRRGKHIVGASVVVRELMSRSTRRHRERCGLNSNPISGVTDSDGYFSGFSAMCSIRVEIAVDGRIYGPFLIDRQTIITIKVRD